MKSDIPPFELYKNIYFIGSSKVSVHIIKTSVGLIMIDTGYPDMYAQIINSMEQLNLNPKDICAIFHSHGHIDHFGCTIKLKGLSGAKTYISAIDNDIVNGNRNLSWANELNLPMPEKFNCDVLINDGDVFKFGDFSIRCLLTPGHTEGVISLFITQTEGDKKTTAAMHGGVGTNSMSADFLNKYSLPFSLRNDFLDGIKRLRNEKVDLVLGNHPQQNNTLQKLKNTKENKSNLDPLEWRIFLNKYEEKINQLILNEKEKILC